MEFNPYDMANFQHDYAGLLRQEEGAQHAAEGNSGHAEPARLAEASGLLQGLGELRLQRPHAEPAPRTDRPRRVPPGGWLHEQVIDSRLRIDRARKPGRKPTPELEVQQHMNNVLEGLEGGQTLSELLQNLPPDVGIHFRLRPAFGNPRGLSNYGEEWLNRQPGSADLRRRFEQALAFWSAWERPAGPVQPEAEVLKEKDTDALKNVLEGLESHRLLQEVLEDYPEAARWFRLTSGGTALARGLTDDGRTAIHRSLGNEVLERFDRALGDFHAWGLLGTAREAERMRTRRARAPAPAPRSGRMRASNERPASTAPASSASTVDKLLREGLMKASSEFLKAGASMATMAEAAGVSEAALREYFTEDGLTQEGWNLVNRCSGSVQAAIMFNVGRGMENRNALRRDQARQEPMAPAGEILPEPSSSVGAPGSDWSGWGFNHVPLHHEAVEPAGLLQREPANSTSSSVGAPGSDWSGWRFNHVPLHHEVVEPAGSLQREPTNSMYQDLSSLGWSHAGRPYDPSTPDSVMGPPGSPQRETTDSGWHGIGSLSEGWFDLNASYEYEDVTGPARPPEPASSSSAYHDDAQGFHGAGISYPGTFAYPAYSEPAWTGAAAAQPAPEIVDVDSYQPRRPEQPRVSAAQRLQGNAWLSDHDILNYTRLMIHRLGESLGPQGLEFINQRLAIADPLQVHHLRSDDARERASVLSHLTAPVLLLPVNRVTEGNRSDHWSLLVVNRASESPQAYHFDSMVPRQYVERAGLIDAFRGQFEVAREVASALGVQELLGRPTAVQDDGHSCGDHVLAGIEELSRRIVHSQGRISWNISQIRPSRQNIIASLVQHEQFVEQANAPGAPRQSLYMEAAPRRNRR